MECCVNTACWLHQIWHDVFRLIVQREAHMPLPPPPACLDTSVSLSKTALGA